VFSAVPRRHGSREAPAAARRGGTVPSASQAQGVSGSGNHKPVRVPHPEGAPSEHPRAEGRATGHRTTFASGWVDVRTRFLTAKKDFLGARQPSRSMARRQRRPLDRRRTSDRFRNEIYDPRPAPYERRRSFQKMMNRRCQREVETAAGPAGTAVVFDANGQLLRRSGADYPPVAGTKADPGAAARTRSG